MWKTVASDVIESKSIKGMRAMTTMAAEVDAVMNGMGRAGGFAPSQWVLGRVPRHSAGEQGDDELAGQVGSLAECVDPTAIFAERMAIRHAAKRAYVYNDSSEKVPKAVLRKAAPKVKDYRDGDIVSFLREQRQTLRRDVGCRQRQES